MPAKSSGRRQGGQERLKEADLAKHAGAYKGEKRKKELLRQKKQEEKRQKRLQRVANQKTDSEATPQEGPDEGTETRGSGTPQGLQ